MPEQHSLSDPKRRERRGPIAGAQSTEAVLSCDLRWAQLQTIEHIIAAKAVFLRLLTSNQMKGSHSKNKPGRWGKSRPNCVRTWNGRQCSELADEGVDSGWLEIGNPERRAPLGLRLSCRVGAWNHPTTLCPPSMGKWVLSKIGTCSLSNALSRPGGRRRSRAASICFGEPNSWASQIHSETCLAGRTGIESDDLQISKLVCLTRGSRAHLDSAPGKDRGVHAASPRSAKRYMNIPARRSLSEAKRRKRRGPIATAVIRGGRYRDARGSPGQPFVLDSKWLRVLSSGV
jgi:hypothetical protein